MTTLDFEFTLPDNIVHVPLRDDASVVAAARSTLARFPAPVARDDAEFEENVFKHLAELARRAVTDEFFVVAHRPPTLGVFASILVRYHLGESAQFVEELAAKDSGGSRFLLEPAEISERSTPLGVATRNLLRYTNEPPAKRRFGWKSQAEIIEQLSWYWHVADAEGDSVVVNLTAFVHDLGLSSRAREIVDGFAAGMRRS